MEKYSIYEKHASIIISLLLVTSFLSISLATIPLVSAAETTIQPSSADSYMNEGAKDTNYGGQTYIEVSSKPSAWGNARGILKFDLSSIPSGSTITSVTLSLYLYSTRGYDRTFGIHKVTKNWTESGVTWNKYDGTNNWTTSGGDYEATASATVTAGAVWNIWVDWSSSTLVSDVQGFVNNPSTNFGWIIKDQTEGSSNQDWVRFYSKEYTGTTLRPKLEVTYTTEGDTTPPAAPTGLTATAVSSSQINLDWNNNTEGDLDHYNVYRSTTSGFTPGPGTFVAETTVSNYSDTGLSASTTYYYKVTAVDTSNNESSPSAQASATTQEGPPPPPPGGWDFQCHSYTHPYLTQLTEAQIQSEMQQVNNAFAAHGLPAPQHHAYPYGDFNSTVKSVVAQYRLSGRAAWAVTGSINTYPMADWYQMNAVEIQSWTAFSTIQGYIDQAIANDALLNIFTHRVMDPAPQYGCTPTMLRNVCSYLLDRQNAGQLQVLPIRDAYTSWNGTQAVVVLSFDDGWKTDYTTTWPIVTGEYGFIGTSYIYPDAQDGQWTDFLSWAEVQEMAGV